jgi:hypothetical protein
MHANAFADFFCISLISCLVAGWCKIGRQLQMLRYKTAEGKKENKFGFGGKPQGAAFARKIVDPWQILATTKACQHIQGGRSISLKASSGALVVSICWGHLVAKSPHLSS